MERDREAVVAYRNWLAARDVELLASLGIGVFWFMVDATLPGKDILMLGLLLGLVFLNRAQYQSVAVLETNKCQRGRRVLSLEYLGYLATIVIVFGYALQGRNPLSPWSCGTIVLGIGLSRVAGCLILKWERRQAQRQWRVEKRKRRRGEVNANINCQIKRTSGSERHHAK